MEDNIRKVLIVSDSHMRTDRILKVIKIEMPDMLIHLGDIEDDPDDIQEYLNKTVNENKGRSLDNHIRSIYVKGNCDRWFKKKMSKAIIFELNGHKVFATHGHGFYVDYGIDDLLSIGKENACDIVMYGHTHVYRNEAIEGIRFLNPGSIAFPRDGAPPSYMILSFDEQGNYTVKKMIFGKE